MERLLRLANQEADVVTVRRAARQLTRLLEFDHHEQVRIVTAVSELVRAAGSGKRDASVEFLIGGERPPMLIVEVGGEGLRVGKQDGERGGPVSGVHAARRLLESCSHLPEAPPDRLRLGKRLPIGASFVSPARAAQIRDELGHWMKEAERNETDELLQQSREMAEALLELERKHAELKTLNAELADTNRGVMALYAELDERATELRRADALKTRFFSNMSHEFRTPLNSIVGLAALLLDEADGPLSDAQSTQVRLIQESSMELLDLVSDLLDIAKVEAGQTSVSVMPFSIAMLFGALRGMIRPLLVARPVVLEFGSAASLPIVVGDEGKTAQILRNFLSNASKFTERGSISVSATLVAPGDSLPGRTAEAEEEGILFAVADTGIGIPADELEVIFHEYKQVEHRLQRTVRGTGLGLSLCRRLASLLGGSVWVTSELGRGSTFYLLIPRVHPGVESEHLGEGRAVEGLPVLVVSDAASYRTALENLFADGLLTPVSMSGADLIDGGLAKMRPVLAVVDAASSAAADVIRRAGIPLLLPDAGLEGAKAADTLLGAAYRLLLPSTLGRVLVVDDDATHRMLLTNALRPYGTQLVAADDPYDAYAKAVVGRFDFAVVDLMMPALGGFDLLQRWREREETVRLAVLMCSSRTLTPRERGLLHHLHGAFVSKSHLNGWRFERGLVEARRAVGSRPTFPTRGEASVA